MRWVLAFLFFFPLATRAEDTPPIEVLVVGVPSVKGVTKYKDSPIGQEAVKVCKELKAFFKGKPVHVTTLCTEEETTRRNVWDKLYEQFHGPSRRRTTLLFLMTHGEQTEETENSDVRLLMSDTTDANKNKQDSTILLREQLEPLLANASGSVAIGFVDTCYSGAAADYRLKNLGAAAETEGVHFGLLASAQAYQQSFDLSFTKALIDTWKTDCPQNPEDFISAVLGRMKEGGSSPVWLVTYHGSACFGELLNPNKRVLSVWRDPARKVQVWLFDDRHNPTKPLRKIPPGVSYINPYVQPVLPGVYRVEARAEENLESVLDKKYCDLSDQSTKGYCEYSFPAQTTALVSLKLNVASYEAAAALGYPSGQLRGLLSKVDSSYRLVDAKEDKVEAAKIIGSPEFVAAVLDTNVGPPTSSHATELAAARNEIANLRNRVSELDELTVNSSNQLKDVDARVQAEFAAVTAKSNDADAHAVDAGNRATQAQQTATQAATRIDAIEHAVSSIDQYQPASQIEILFSRGELALSGLQKEKLNKLAADLKNERGYVVEVLGFASGPAAVSRSQQIADAVVRDLVASGVVPLYRIYSLGMGAGQNQQRASGEPPKTDRVKVTLFRSVKVLP